MPLNSAVTQFILFTASVLLALGLGIAWYAMQRRRAACAGQPQLDQLTGLLTRRSFFERAEHALHLAGQANEGAALLLFNVDRLRSVNDSFGHEAGDELLRELAARLRRALPADCTCARLASDEFVVLALGARDAQDAEDLARSMRSALSSPMRWVDSELAPSITTGASIFPKDGATCELLLKRAQAAMRFAKDRLPGGFTQYSTGMHRRAQEQLALEAELRGALDTGQLELHYQPKVDIATNRVRSAEALLRWRHPRRGLVPPAEFIPIAEENGLILPIGEWVLREACRQMRLWIEDGLPPVRVAVNLSARQFRQADLHHAVAAAIEDAAIQPGYLELELTESSVMHDPEASAATLKLLSEMGVHISIDDFGSGYSSLSYLRRFPLDKLKIDRSFLRELKSNPDDFTIVKAIISLAHSLRLRVVAEGVETFEQLELLRELGCDQYQGFFCSAAVPPDEFVRLLQRLRAGRAEFTEADMLKTQSRLSAYRVAVGDRG